MENYRRQLGYVTDVQGLCINGYVGDTVLYQDNSGDTIGKQRKAYLYGTYKGIYFSFKGKRVYVHKY